MTSIRKAGGKELLLVAALLFLLPVAAYGQFQFYPLTPCRIVDTRNPPGPTGGPSLVNNQTRNFPIIAFCGVPSTARAATFNLTLVMPGASGHLIVWPYNTAVPGVSNLNYVAGEPAIANGAVVPLTSDLTFHVSAMHASGMTSTADLIIDVTGYYAP